MFGKQSIFGAWGGSQVGGGDHDGDDGPSGDSALKFQLSVDEAVALSKNDDELADLLLTQFPAFGSYSSAATSAANASVMQEKKLGSPLAMPTASLDWMGSSSVAYNNNSIDPNSDQYSVFSQHTDYSNAVNESYASSRTRGLDRNSREPTIVEEKKALEPWDDDEQELWQRTIPSALLETEGGNEVHGDQPQQYPTEKHHHRAMSPIASDERFQLPRKAWVRGAGDPEGSPTKKPIVDTTGTAMASPPASRRYFSTPFSSRQAALQAQQRQYWMPDQLCKQCYSCETQFTVFRRRHHCRICGQVFCNACSAYFVPVIVPPAESAAATTAAATPAANAIKTTVRVCQMCNETVHASGGPASIIPLDDNDATAVNKNSNATDLATPMRAKDPKVMVKEDAIEIFETPVVNKTLRNARPGSHWAKAESAAEPSSILGKLRQRLDSTDDTTTPQESVTVPGTPNSMRRHTSAESADSLTWLTTTMSAATKAGTKQPQENLQGTSVSSLEVQDPVIDIEKTDHIAEEARVASRRLGQAAAQHLELMAQELLKIHAPTLWNDLVNDETTETKEDWINQLLALATRCCATVEPNVKRGDALDIRPYCKIKVVSGGSCNDSAYLSGVMFRKSVSHKKMAKVLENPRIMLLSGSIEFTRTENKIASLDALVEQEEKYTEILVGKILKVKPEVLMVGRSVSRFAQELFLKHGIVLLQHVKANLLSRIARQTGSTVISSTDHHMNQFSTHALGKCRRFRLVTFRDNERWVDGDLLDSRPRSRSPVRVVRSVKDVLDDPGVSTSERQAALAADQLGEDALDGVKAVTSGLAKRGVTQTFVMLEGCPKHLGCTVVLRGASRAALKEVKQVFRFLVNAAYNLRLETTYLKERCATIREGFEVRPPNACSTSLCVEYGSIQGSRNIRPWNGDNNDSSPTPESADISAFDHQSILVTSIWMTKKPSVQCCPAEMKGVCFYDSLQDVSLGQFLRDSCFKLSLTCQNTSCKRSVLDHSLSFVHNDGLMNIMVEEMDEFLPQPPVDTSQGEKDDVSVRSDPDDEVGDPIATWTYCLHCKKVVTPLVFISEETWKFSFGKFLDIFFYNRDAVMNAPKYGCSCRLQSSAALYYGCGKLAARFTYEPVKPYNVFIRPSLPADARFHQEEAARRIELISRESSVLFVKFDKHIDKVSREARSLFNSAVNRPEHLQTVLSELNSIASDVDHAAKTLQAKISSVADECRREGAMNETLFRFPWFARRYLFTLMSSWNDKLSTVGQAISAMRKLASSMSGRQDGGIGPNVSAVVGEQYNEQLTESMKRLRQLNSHYSSYSVTDISEALPVLQGDLEMPDVDDDDEFDDSEIAVDVDADVLASRRRFRAMRQPPSIDSQRGGRILPTKSLGTRRDGESDTGTNPPKSAPGGVRSALTRFFNRGGRELDPYTVDLGIFQAGRPRLAPGESGVVVPVVDEQLSTVIAYSLASTEYARQFKAFARVDPSSVSDNNIAEPNLGGAAATADSSKVMEQQMLAKNKSHIKHSFKDYNDNGRASCKFVCTSYWATQFHAVRQVFLAGQVQGANSNHDILDLDQSYVESLSSAVSWAASGGKSGASFSRTSDHRFVIKCISRTELQMFLDCAPLYFEYLSRAFFHGLPTVLCKIVGVYEIGVHNRVTGKRTMDQVAVMQNIFYNRNITKTFDLKGSLRGRFAAQKAKDEAEKEKQTRAANSAGKARSGGEEDLDEPTTGSSTPSPGTLLDGDFLEFTNGKPMPMTDRAKQLFQMSTMNDALFLSIINVLDYSILVGVDEEKMELVVGIIDFMRQYDILKQMERVGKSLPMVVGSEPPTIIQPPLYKARFTDAMETYFMKVPTKWTQMP